MSETQTPFFNLSQLKHLEAICDTAAVKFLEADQFNWAKRALHYRKFFQDLIIETEKEDPGK